MRVKNASYDLPVDVLAQLRGEIEEACRTRGDRFVRGMCHDVEMELILCGVLMLLVK